MKMKEIKIKELMLEMTQKKNEELAKADIIVRRIQDIPDAVEKLR